MQPIRHAVSHASFLLAVVGGIGTFATMMIVIVDVAMRAFGSNVPGALEVVTYYLMLMVAFLPLARIERSDGMITVDILYTTLARTSKRWVALFVALGSTVLYFTVAYATLEDALHHFEKGAFVYTLKFTMPVWPAYFIIPVAFALAGIVTLLRVFEVMGGALPDDTSEGSAMMAGLVADGAVEGEPR
jgi:TRAP-type C4-dicarboxylate transport system permease small subunit